MYQQRGYRHLDSPVGISFAQRSEDASFVARHSFLPLLHYEKRTKRYRPLKHKTEFKKRPIMYASHRDACILSRYAHVLTNVLNEYYVERGLSECVMAYRQLGKANYHFAEEVVEFARKIAPCSILSFDITGFFDNLDHRLLKDRLKRVLQVSELSRDWYAVFRHVTRFSWVWRDDLKNHPKFGERFNGKRVAPIATIAEVRAEGVKISKNANRFGIPQGTPISSAFSNLYMIDFDAALQGCCKANGALYKRYSDDILIVCPKDAAEAFENFIKGRIKLEKLTLNESKSERHVFDPSKIENAQYLGFNFSPDGVTIRQSSLSRQWRKMRKSLKRIRKAGEAAIAAGKADKVFTKTLRRRFTAQPVRNFSSYARRSAKALNSPKILRQIRRLERAVENELRDFPSPKRP
ncbi:MAG: antiviral reverse transcriptase Drt2 [Rhodospirillales bacterium]